MPLFGSGTRPKIDGLTKEEEKRRDSLSGEVTKRSPDKQGQPLAVIAVLEERIAAEPREWLWPHVLGWHLLSLHRYDASGAALEEAMRLRPGEVRSYYAAGSLYFEAAEAKAKAAAEGLALPEPAMGDQTAVDLYEQARRYFRKALDMTKDREERDVLSNAASTAERALSRGTAK